MRSGRRSGLVLGLGLAALLMAFVAGGFALAPPERPGSSAREKLPPILEETEDGLLFTYHVLTGTEGLFDLRTDPRCLRNLLGERPDDAAVLRRRLCVRVRVDDLSELSDPEDPQLIRLRNLGYL